MEDDFLCHSEIDARNISSSRVVPLTPAASGGGEPGGWRAKRKEREGRIIGGVERTGRDIIVGMNTPEKSEKREVE